MLEMLRVLLDRGLVGFFVLIVLGIVVGVFRARERAELRRCDDRVRVLRALQVGPASLRMVQLRSSLPSARLRRAVRRLEYEGLIASNLDTLPGRTRRVFWIVGSGDGPDPLDVVKTFPSC